MAEFGAQRSLSSVLQLWIPTFPREPDAPSRSPGPLTLRAIFVHAGFDVRALQVRQSQKRYPLPDGL